MTNREMNIMLREAFAHFEQGMGMLVQVGRALEATGPEWTCICHGTGAKAKELHDLGGPRISPAPDEPRGEALLERLRKAAEGESV